MPERAPRSSPICWSRPVASPTTSSPAGTAGASAASARISGSSAIMSGREHVAHRLAALGPRRPRFTSVTANGRQPTWSGCGSIGSPSMLFKSAGRPGRQAIARAGAGPSRWPNCCRAAASARLARRHRPAAEPRNAAERLGQALALARHRPDCPAAEGVRNGSAEIVCRQRFPRCRHDALAAHFRAMPRHGARGHLVEIVDPVEENFPYAGRVEFSDPETGDKLTAGSAPRPARRLSPRCLPRHVETVRSLARAIGWSHTLHHTDQPASRGTRLAARRMTSAGDSWSPH